MQDGNRRIAALKILNNPSEAPKEYYARFSSIIAEAVTEIPAGIRCTLVDSRKIALSDMQFRHLGAQGGAGQIEWGSREKGNHAEHIGEKPNYSAAREICKYYN